MKYFFRALPTLLLVGICYVIATSPPHSTLSESARQSELHLLHRQLSVLRRELENYPPPPFLPRGMGALAHP
jgi:hypothetical protein